MFLSTSEQPAWEGRREAGVWMHGLLAATVALPVLAFGFGTCQGQVAFVLYREPKMAAIQMLGCGLMAALFWRFQRDFQVRNLAAVLLRPPWIWLVAFTGYGSVTLAWAAVPENGLYELGQYGLLLLLVACLDVWAARDPAVPRWTEGALVLSVGVAVAVGLVQRAVAIRFLSPIDPGSGVPNPSFMGYKNPMALAIVGQVFLLARWAVSAGPGRGRRLLGVSLAAELAYLATLKSRTSYVALVGAALFLLILFAVRERFRPKVLRAALGGLVAAGLFFSVLAADPVARGRAASLFKLSHPARYLESDRGIYLLNSLQMVRHHPLGIGWGDWASQYPVYRRHHRDVYFTANVQVRKAHSDHVQTFAETGWPGLSLWAGFWISLLAAPLARYVRSGETEALFGSAQLVAFGIAMATDYVTEHPYLKLEFVLIAFLAGRRMQAPAAQAGRTRLSPAVLITFLALGAGVLSVCQVRKAALGALVTERYVTAMARGGDAALLAEASRAGEALTRTPGFNKGLGDDLRVLAQVEARLGHGKRARELARASLRLAPYSPNTLTLMAELQRDHRPDEAAEWSRAAQYVLEEATEGFEKPYPATSG